MEQSILKLIEKSLIDLQFGSVELTIHDGVVTQIERREKLRPYRTHDGEKEIIKKKSGRTSGEFREG
jgi:hypothetical protein